MPEQTATRTPATGANKGPRGRRRQKSRFGSQMEEKQNLKAIYGIREAHLKRYYRAALESADETGPEMLRLLELRLDNTLYRSGFAETRRAARQLASHRHVLVNNRPVDIPSFRLKPGDVVTIKESKRGKGLFENFQKRLQNVAPPEWISLDPELYSFKITSRPDADSVGIGVDMRAVVEYFAR